MEPTDISEFIIGGLDDDRIDVRGVVFGLIILLMLIYLYSFREPYKEEPYSIPDFPNRDHMTKKIQLGPK